MADPVQATDATPAAAAPAADASLLDGGVVGATGAEGVAPAKPAAEAATPESKPAGDKPAGDDKVADEKVRDLLADDDDGTPEKKADGPADAEAKAPETYEAFTLPEGVVMDEALLAKATPVLKSVAGGLTQEDAQKLVSFFADVQADAAKQQLDGFNQVKKDWINELKTDSEFGGDKFDKTVGAAKAVIAKYGDKGLLNELKEWGWGNNPRLIRLLARVHANLSEDTLVKADTAAQPGAPRKPWEIMYGDSMKPKE